MERRDLLSCVAALPLLASLSATGAAIDQAGALKIVMKSAGACDDPTKAVFPFLHGHALAEDANTVQIFLLGEAVSLMRASVAKAVVPVGWPPLAEVLYEVVSKKIEIYACGACSRARSVTDGDLAPCNAKFGNPAIFVSLVKWADRVITE